MSETVDLSEFIPSFLVEAGELLGVAHAQLLAVEESTRAGSSNPRAVRELFRALHTIKGLAAMVDVEPIVAIAHRMESSLRGANGRGGVLPASSIEPLLQGLKAIEVRVRALGDHREMPPAPAALLDALEGLDSTGGALPGAPPAREVVLRLEPTLEAKLTASEREQLLEGARRGLRGVCVDFVPSVQRAAEGLNINTVRERVAKVAETVKVVPLAKPVSAGQPGGLLFALILLTAGSDQEIAEAVGVEQGEVRLVVAPLPSESPASKPAPVELAFEGLDDEVEPRRHGIVRVEATRIDDAMERLAALIVNRSRLQRAAGQLTSSGADTRELAQVMQENVRQMRDLRAALVRLRMVPVKEVLERLPLIVRGLRRSTGKQVRLELEVGGAEMDKAVGDRLFPVVVHLVRNAVDHALEAPEERRALGKPVEGLLRVTCVEQTHSRLELTVSDDGRGVDAAAVAARAGVPAPDTSQGLLELLCRPGLSTREQVTETSGRGMGMNIVRSVTVDELGGELRMESRPGAGTTFRLHVPLTLSIMDALVLECGGRRYAVPANTVEELIEVDPRQLVQGPAREQGRAVILIERRGATVPLVQLEWLLAQSPATTGATRAIVVRQRGEPVAFAVDRLMGKQEVVVRPLADPLVRVRGVSGATDLGDGRPTLVLDLAALGEAGERAGHGELG